jgi:nucleotide-binding universal stress UspA family protein
VNDSELPEASALPNPQGRVLAAIDGSIYGESVADLAAWAALRLGAPLQFLHVLEREPAEAAPADLSGSLALDAQAALLSQLTEFDAQRSRFARERGRLLLESAAARARAAGARLEETRLRHDHLLDALLELEPAMRLCVLGKRGEHADFASGHLGGQVERVVRALKHPLLIAARAFKTPSRAMLAFDGSATVMKGVRMLCESPLLRGLPIRLQMAADAPHPALQEAAQQLRAAGFEVETAVAAGHPEEVLAAAVREHAIDLLVMGAYGHSRIRQFFVGSTTTALLRACQVPVLLLR